MIATNIIATLVVAAPLVVGLPTTPPMPAEVVKFITDHVTSAAAAPARALQVVKAPTRVRRRRDTPSASPSPSPSPSVPGGGSGGGGGGGGSGGGGDGGDGDGGNGEPPIPECGRILVESLDPDFEFEGYIQADLVLGLYPATQGRPGAVEVTYDEHLLTPQNGNAQYPVIGGTLVSQFPDLNRGNPNFAVLTSTNETAYGEPAEVVGTQLLEGLAEQAGLPSESAIFYLDNATGEITTQWVNSDGAFVELDFIFVTGGPILIGDGDLYQDLQEVEGLPIELNTVSLFCENFVTAAAQP